MHHRAALAIHELEEIEKKYDVSFVARGGSYGSAHLCVRCNITGEEKPVSEIMSFIDINETSE